MDGVAKESIAVKKALAQLERQLTQKGMKLIAAMYEDQAATAFTGATLIASYIARSKLKEVAIGAAKGLGSTIKGLSSFDLAVGKASLAIGAFGLGYAIGTLIDDMTGASDKLSDWVWGLQNPDEKKRRDKAAEDERVNRGKKGVDDFLEDMEKRQDFGKTGLSKGPVRSVSVGKEQQGAGETSVTVVIEDKTKGGVKQRAMRGRKQ